MAGRRPRDPVGGDMHQDDRGDHDDSAGSGTAAGQPPPVDLRPAPLRRRSAGRVWSHSTTTTSGRARRAHSAQPPAPRAGSSHGRSQSTRRVPPPLSQRCSSRTLLGSRPAQRLRSRQDGGGSARQRLDHRHRRHAPAGHPGRSEPAVAHHGQLPGRCRPGEPDHLPRSASAASRWARPSAPTSPASRSRLRAAASNRSCPASVVTSSARVCGGPSSAPSTSLARPRRPGRSRRRPGARRTGAAQRRSSRGRTARRAARRDPQRARPQRHGGQHGVDGLARVVLGAEGAERSVARRRHHRQPGEGLRGGRHPPRRVRVARPAVVARRCAAISLSSRTPASSACAQTIVSTRSAWATMSRMRRRRSPAVK